MTTRINASVSGSQYVESTRSAPLRLGSFGPRASAIPAAMRLACSVSWAFGLQHGYCNLFFCGIKNFWTRFCPETKLLRLNSIVQPLLWCMLYIKLKALHADTCEGSKGWDACKPQTAGVSMQLQNIFFSQQCDKLKPKDFQDMSEVGHPPKKWKNWKIWWRAWKIITVLGMGSTGALPYIFGSAADLCMPRRAILNASGKIESILKRYKKWHHRTRRTGSWGPPPSVAVRNVLGMGHVKPHAYGDDYLTCTAPKHIQYSKEV